MNKDKFIGDLSKKYSFEIESNKDNLATGDKIIVKSNTEIKKESVVSILGDVTGTGNINVSDVAKSYQYYKKRIDMAEEYVIAADVVKDNEIKINDVAKLYQYYKKRIPSLEG